MLPFFTKKPSVLHRWRRAAPWGYLRALVALVALQVAGLPVCIIALSMDAEPGCSADCSDDAQAQGLPCPPFCATCTCVHAPPLGLDRTPAVAALAPQLSTERLLPCLRLEAPPLPEPSRIFRPPRADDSV